MSDSRAYHACTRIKRSGRDYLMVAGGLYGVTGAETNTIEFYDLTLMPTSWVFLPGISMPGFAGPMLGGIITAFDEGICEATFINHHGQFCVCAGNYSWASNSLAAFKAGWYYSPVIDANLFGGDAVW